jgi:serine protease Do
MPSSLSRARLGAAVVTAFVCGLLFASGFDLTRFGFAQDGKAAKVASSQVQSLAETGSAFEAIADHVTPSVVSIQTTRITNARQRGGSGRPDIEEFFRNFQPPTQQREPQEASGTGFVVSKDGYILTNNHVVADADKVTVTLLDKRTFDAKVIGRDPTTDVAVIKIDGENLPVASLGDDNNARVGQWVVAIGNPLGLDFTVTAGIISAKGRPLQGLLGNRGYEITDYIQTDAAINPGNSGGPLVNIRGEVIGINSAIASSTGFYAGYGFAIPVTLAKQVMDDLIKYGKVRRAVMGVSIMGATAADTKAAGMKEVTGVFVRAFNTDEAGNSPAKEAGVQPGDVIVAADGKATDRVSTLQRIIRGHKPGDVVTLDVMRFGEKKSFKVKLIEASDQSQVASAEDASSETQPAAATESRRFDKLGITVEPVSPALASRARMSDAYRRGLMVSDVNVTGPARGKIFADNTVLLQVLNPAPQRELHSAADLDAVLARLRKGDVVTFLVYDVPQGPQDRGSTHAVSLEVGQ